MRPAISLFIDIISILLATLAAVVLRDNFEFSSARLVAVTPYFVCTAIASAIVLPLLGVNRAFWRFSAIPDYLRIVASLLVIIVASVALTFTVNRVDGVPRSLPPLQFYLAATLLIGARVLYRMRSTFRETRRRSVAPLNIGNEPASITLLLIGLSPLTEIYLQCVTEFARRRISIAGILGRQNRHVGRLVAQHRVLGIPGDLERVLSELEVNGVSVDRIVITASFGSLSRRAREAIAAVQRSGSVQVQYLPADLGFESVAQWETSHTSDGRPVRFEISADELEIMQRRRYWKAKRVIDVAATMALLPLWGLFLILIGTTVAFTMGWPLIFWQQRPGLGGRPFRLYKFRTMDFAIAADGRKLSDSERVSRVGNFLRRTRLDELPQVFNILRGDMSLVGPRPLLPRDQHDACRARLLVRPGLSGWAQVIGGRAISADDKAALDVWYVRNASLWLDIIIVLRTIPMVFFGERTCKGLIDQAWQDLQEARVLKGQFVHIEPANTPAI